MNLSDLEQLNECADFLYEVGVTVTPVMFPELSDLWTATGELQNHCVRLHLAPPWEDFCRINRILYYCLAGGICPPSYVMRELAQDLRSGYSAIQPLAGGASREVRDILNQISKPETGVWARLVRLDCSPFYTALSVKLEEATKRRQKNAAFVLRHNRLKVHTLELLKPFQNTIQLAVCKSNELRDHPRIDCVFYIGSMRSLRRLDEEFLIRAPITDEFHFFELSQTGAIQNAGLDVFALDPARRFPINKALAIGNVDGIKSKTSTQVADDEFEGDQSTDTDEILNDGDADRAVDSFRAILGGGFGANLGTESDVFIAHCRKAGPSLICTKIEKKDVLDLEPGDLVVLTTEGSGDMIAPYADQIIGAQAQTFRDLQRAWKRELAELVNRIGMEQVIDELRATPDCDISEPNLRQWLGQTIHGPRSESLFIAILTLLRRVDKIEIHKEALSRIRDASVRAGHHLQSELRRELEEKNLTPVLSEGYMEFRLDANGPAKTIFELQKLATAVRSVRSHHINRVFKLKRGEYEA
jgi:hypothetical protein